MEAIHFTSYLDVLPKLNITYITVPKEVVDEVGGIGARLLCSINGHESFQCGMVAKGGGAAYISVNKKRRSLWKLEDFEEELKITLEPDPSEYGMAVPEELAALLEQDDEGHELFELLTDGQQRYIIYYVSQVKSSQLKIDRAILLINNLKTMPAGKFDFRHLLGLPPREE